MWGPVQQHRLHSIEASLALRNGTRKRGAQAALHLWWTQRGALKSSGSMAVGPGSFGHLTAVPSGVGWYAEAESAHFHVLPLNHQQESLLDQTLVRQALLNPLPN